jgi:hypothetical protein
MPALIAYLICISVFLSGGYFGLNFLAGNFDEPRQTVSRPSDAAQGVKEKAKSITAQLPVPRAEAQVSPVFLSDQSDAQSKELRAEAETALVDHSVLSSDTTIVNQAANVMPAETIAALQSSVTDERNTFGEDGSHGTAANFVKGQNASMSVSDDLNLNIVSNATKIEPKAKTTQTVTNVGSQFRSIAASINSKLVKRSVNSVRKDKDIRAPR